MSVGGSRNNIYIYNINGNCKVPRDELEPNAMRDTVEKGYCFTAADGGMVNGRSCVLSSLQLLGSIESYP